MDYEAMADLRGELHSIYAVLTRIAEGIERHAAALETLNNAAIKGAADSDGHIEVFATTHEV